MNGYMMREREGGKEINRDTKRETEAETGVGKRDTQFITINI